MQILNNISLKQYNTFGIDVNAKYFASAATMQHVTEILEWALQHKAQSLVLGGGSNVLFTKDFAGLIIRNELKGIEKINEDDEQVFIRVSAGVVWHEFVLFCLKNNYAGIENLALIPGFTGASPMQNIGAYGVEIKDVFHELTAIHKFDLHTQKFKKADCAFGYRESVFKNKYKDQFLITDVTYRLHKKPQFNIEYGAIRQELEKNNVQQLSIQAIANAVMAIRSSKLPDPKQIGNAGSFFKNPSVTKEKYRELKEKFPAIVGYENTDGTVKLAAAWLIEQCGFKGYKKGDAGVHDKQALVLVNRANASGDEILKICHEIKNAVLSTFEIVLAPEVNII